MRPWLNSNHNKLWVSSVTASKCRGTSLERTVSGEEENAQRTASVFSSSVVEVKEAVWHVRLHRFAIP